MEWPLLSKLSGDEMAQLSGKVTGVSKPLTGILVQVDTRLTRTSRTGYYRIQKLTIGNKVVKFSKTDWKAQQIPVTIKTTGNVLNVVMIPEIIGNLISVSWE